MAAREAFGPLESVFALSFGNMQEGDLSVEEGVAWIQCYGKIYNESGVRSCIYHDPIERSHP